MRNEQTRTGSRSRMLLACAMAFLFVFPGCGTSEQETPDPVELTYTVDFNVVNAKSVETSLSGFDVELSTPSGSLKTYTSSSSLKSGDVLSIDASDLPSGEYGYTISKEGFVSSQGRFSWDASVLKSDESFTMDQKAYLTKIEPFFQVHKGQETRMYFDNGDVEVIIPEGAVAEDMEISVTRVVTPYHRNELSEVNGKMAFDCLHLLPEGTTFDKPITIRFKAEGNSLLQVENTNLQLAYFHSNTESWELKDVEYDGNFFSSSIDHFSDWYLIANDYKLQLIETEMSDFVLDTRCEAGKGINDVLTVGATYEASTGSLVIPEELEKYMEPMIIRVVEPSIVDCDQHLKVAYTIEHYQISKLIDGSTDTYEEIGLLHKPSYPIMKWLYAIYVGEEHHGGGGS